MKIFLYCFFVLVALSCKKSDVDVPGQDTVLDEYPDWYTLKAPIDHEISGVWGNYVPQIKAGIGNKGFISWGARRFAGQKILLSFATVNLEEA